MNILDPWNAVFLGGLLLQFNIRRVFVKRLRLDGRKKAISRFDGLEKALLFGMTLAVILLPLLYLFTPLLNFANYPLPIYVRVAGAVVMSASLWLFWRSHADLAENWSVSLELREGHQLVRDGVYRRIRHPMYAAIWLWAVAQGMLLDNWLAGWAVVPAFAAMYFLRMPREEQLLCDEFGDEYRAYMQATGRLLPRFHRPTNEVPG